MDEYEVLVRTMKAWADEPAWKRQMRIRPVLDM